MGPAGGVFSGEQVGAPAIVDNPSETSAAAVAPAGPSEAKKCDDKDKAVDTGKGKGKNKGAGKGKAKTKKNKGGDSGGSTTADDPEPKSRLAERCKEATRVKTIMKRALDDAQGLIDKFKGDKAYDWGDHDKVKGRLEAMRASTDNALQGFGKEFLLHEALSLIHI